MQQPSVGRARWTVRLVAEEAVKRKLVPGSDGKYELAGFGWHQGWNDRINDSR